MKYVRLCRGLTDKGMLVPETDDIMSHITDPNKDHYVSIFRYNEDQYNIYKKQGGSVAGIREVETDKIYWDFDKKGDPSKAKADAEELCNRLIQKGIKEDDIFVAFSGRKGFEVTVITNYFFKPKEVENICSELAKGLSTFDDSMYDHSQIFRVPNTKHHDTGLFKIPLSVQELCTTDIETIKDLAKKQRAYTPKTSVDLPEEVIKYAEVEQEEEVVEVVNNGVDFDAKPKWMHESKWLLQLGYYDEGEGNEARMILAATYKAQGFDRDMTANMLYLAEKRRSERLKVPPTSAGEIHRQILNVVYGPFWTGGQYSVHSNKLLRDLCARFGISTDEEDEFKPIFIHDVAQDFRKFAKEIDKNRIFTGLETLDKKIVLTTGMHVGLVGAPGCHARGTEVVLYDGSIKKVEDVVVGDVLMGPDSKPRNVLALCRGREAMVRITPNRSESFIVNMNHILNLRPSKAKQKGRIPGDLNITVKNYIEGIQKAKGVLSGYVLHKTGVVYEQQQQLPIDPYYIGLWLGDGTTGSTAITKPDPEIAVYLQSLAKEWSANYGTHDSNGTRCVTHTLTTDRGLPNPILNILRSLNILNNKHIPHMYMIASRKDRLALLAGLIDSDGTLESNKAGWNITQKSERASRQIAALARSLGFHANVTSKVGRCWYKGVQKEGMYWGIYIAGPDAMEVPLKLSRKRVLRVAKNKATNHYGFTYEILPEDDYFGFTLDRDHLYVTSDYFVHHNSSKTSIALQWLKHNSKNNIPCVFASLDMTPKRVYEKLALQIFTDKGGQEALYEHYKADDEIADEIDRQIKESLKNVNLFCQSSPNVDRLSDYIKLCEDARGEKMKFVVIDYFERLNSELSDDTAASKDVAGKLQDLMHKHDILLVTLLQPRKMSGDLRMPITSYTDIKGSSFIQQSLRAILSVYREGFDPTNPAQDKFVTINAVKNDLGETFSLDFAWSGREGKISPLVNRDDIRQLAGIRHSRDHGDEESDESYAGRTSGNAFSKALYTKKGFGV